MIGETVSVEDVGCLSRVIEIFTVCLKVNEPCVTIKTALHSFLKPNSDTCLYSLDNKSRINLIRRHVIRNEDLRREVLSNVTVVFVRFFFLVFFLFSFSVGFLGRVYLYRGIPKYWKSMMIND